MTKYENYLLKKTNKLLVTHQVRDKCEITSRAHLLGSSDYFVVHICDPHHHDDVASKKLS
jgi:hypothetical protein